MVDKGKIENAIESILEAIGEDPSREGLVATPARVARAYAEIFAGIEVDPQSILETTFNERYTGLVTLSEISFFSMCEHHLLPFYGFVSIGYIPNGKIAGLSKFARLVDALSKRPQVQERLTIQIVKELQKVLNTEDVACVIDAKHLCVNSRGIRDVDSSTVTSEFGGKFKEKETRREFLDYIKLDTSF